jgi:hypothetical protein
MRRMRSVIKAMNWRLQIGRESQDRAPSTRRRPARAGAHDHQPPIGRPDLSAGAFQDRTDRAEVLEMGAEDLEMTRR